MNVYQRDKTYLRWQKPTFSLAQILPEIIEEEKFMTHNAAHRQV